MILTDCTISANVAGSGPGASCFMPFPSPGYFTNGPAGGARGAGIQQTGGFNSPTLRNTIVAGNHANSLPNDIAANVSSQGYNLIGVTNGSTGWIAS